jgi:hypothetical protein
MAQRSSGGGESAAETYATFWDAIPIDSDDAPSPVRADNMDSDPYVDFLALTEEDATSWLTVEEAD